MQCDNCHNQSQTCHKSHDKWNMAVSAQWSYCRGYHCVCGFERPWSDEKISCDHATATKPRMSAAVLLAYFYLQPLTQSIAMFMLRRAFRHSFMYIVKDIPNVLPMEVANFSWPMLHLWGYQLLLPTVVKYSSWESAIIFQSFQTCASKRTTQWVHLAVASSIPSYHILINLRENRASLLQTASRG